MRRSFVRRLASVICMWTAAVSVAAAEPTPTSVLPYRILGGLSSFARAGNTLFLGDAEGALPWANVGRGLFVFSPVEAVHRPIATPNGPVYAVIADGAGGWYIGGNFASVDGVPRRRLAHILANGAVDPAFVADLQGGAFPFSMALANGFLYLAGDFTTVNLVPRQGVAIVNAQTGQVQAGAPGVTGGFVYNLAVSGSTLYVTGDFTMAGGQPRTGAAAFNAITGALIPGFVANATGGIVKAIVVSGTSVFLGGSFAAVNGTARGDLAKVDAATGSVDPTWNPGTDGEVSALALSGNIVYVGGQFATIAGQPRSHAAALDPTSGAATGWNPGVGLGTGIRTMAVSGGTVYLGGGFETVGGQDRFLAAAVTASTPAAVLPWSPSPLGLVSAIAIAPGSGMVAVAGDLSGWGFIRRYGILSIDLLSGEILPWNPVFSSATFIGDVNDLAIDGNRLYVGGAFVKVNGESRVNLAAFDVTTKELLPLSASFDGPISAITVSGNTVYAGGTFSQVNSAFRIGLAALNSSTGQLLPWDIQADGAVTDLAVYQDRVLIAGAFSSLVGTNGIRVRYGLGEVTTAGEVTALDVMIAPTLVTSLALSGPRLYVGGGFSIPGHANVAAIDLPTRTLLPWNPNVDGGVNAVSVHDGLVHLAGAFANVGGQAKPRIARVRESDAGVTAWTVTAPPSAARTVLAYGPGVIVGGAYVRALASGNYSDAAGLYPEQALGGVPGPPVAPDVKIDSGALTVSWQPPFLGAPPSGYLLEAGTGPGLANIGSVPVASTSFSVAGVPPGVYYLRIRAGNGAGLGIASREIVLSVGSGTCTTPPLSLFDVRGSVAGSTVILNWAPTVGSAPTTYTLLAGTASGLANIGSVPVGGTTSFSATSVPAGNYYIQVIAANGCGQRAPLAEAILHIGPVQGPPGEPIHFTGATTPGTVSLSWQASTGGLAAGYVLEAGSGPGLSNIATVPLGPATSIGASGVPAGTYYLRLRAFNIVGPSPPSGELVLVVP